CFDEASNFLDLALSEIRGGTNDRQHNYAAVGDVQVDGLCEAYGFFETRFGNTHRVHVAMRAFSRSCTGCTLPQIGTHDQRTANRCPGARPGGTDIVSA